VEIAQQYPNAIVKNNSSFFIFKMWEMTSVDAVLPGRLVLGLGWVFWGKGVEVAVELIIWPSHFNPIANNIVTFISRV
jgi:hypothetical protein